MADAAADVQRVCHRVGTYVPQSGRAKNPANLKESMAYLNKKGPRGRWTSREQREKVESKSGIREQGWVYASLWGPA